MQTHRKAASGKGASENGIAHSCGVLKGLPDLMEGRSFDALIGDQLS